MIVANLILADILQPSSTESSTAFFTVQTLFTAAGSATAVFTVTSVIRVLLPKLSPRWFAAFFSLVLTIAGVRVNQQTYGAVTLLLAFINAAVVYAAAVGVNNITTSAGTPGGAALPEQTGAHPSVTARSYRWWQ